MKFLEDFGFDKVKIAEFLSNTPKKLIDEIKTNKKLVSANLSYLKDIGVKNYQEIFLEYYDMFLMDNSNFVTIFNKYEPDDLIDKLEKNIKIIEYL